MHNRPWGEGQQLGAVYVLSEDDNSRFGSHWFKGRVRDGDVVLCTEHSGDCFYNYKLFHVYGNGLMLCTDSPRMCGYCLGKLAEGELSAREYHLLMAGEMVEMDESRVKTFQTPREQEPQDA